MAFSSSIKRAQAIKLCELCNEDNIKWRCIDCGRCLCQKCKTIHLRVPITAKHQIVTIATPIKAVQRKVVTDNIPCTNHETKMHCLFCKTCDSLVCPECVSSSHGNHKFIPIEKALDEKLEQLKGIKTKVSDNIKVCDLKTTEIKRFMPIYHSIFDESVAKIKQKEEELKEIISKHSKVLQQKVEAERSTVKSILIKVEQEVNEARNSLEYYQQDLQSALASNQGQAIFETSFSEPVLKFDPLPDKVESFVSQAKTEIQIQELFGSFKTKTIPIVKPKFVFEVLKTFTTDLPFIHQVLPLDENTAWVSCYTPNKSVMRKVTIQDNNIITTNETNISVYDMALTPDTDLLLSVYGESDVKLMTKSGKTKHFLTVSPLITTGIHMTRDNKLIVGVKELGNPYTPTEQSERAVTVYDKDGKQRYTYQKDKDGKRLFTLPRRVITNNNQDMIVIDRTSGESGRVVTLDGEGNLRWIYEGHSTINDYKSFNPLGITTTTTGYIIVSDYGTHVLHVLSENGEVLTCKVMDGMGIKYPIALNIDKGGKLWIGCDRGGEDFGAKLHILKLKV